MRQGITTALVNTEEYHTDSEQKFQILFNKYIDISRERERGDPCIRERDVDKCWQNGNFPTENLELVEISLYGNQLPSKDR